MKAGGNWIPHPVSAPQKTSPEMHRLGQINQNDYLQAMQASVVNPSHIHSLLASALTDKINDRETFMKGIDYSYYYEQED